MNGVITAIITCTGTIMVALIGFFKTNEKISLQLTGLQEDNKKTHEKIKEIYTMVQSNANTNLKDLAYTLEKDMNEFLLQGYVSDSEYDSLTEMYQLYKSLGGNGRIERKYTDKFKNLEKRG